MKLRRDSLFVRYCYLWEEIPEQSNVCTLFWRMIGQTLAFICMAFIAVAGSYLVWSFWWEVLQAVLCIAMAITIFVLVILVFVVRDRLRSGDWTLPAPVRVTGAWIAAKKRRLCPIVELVSEDSESP